MPIAFDPAYDLYKSPASTDENNMHMPGIQNKQYGIFKLPEPQFSAPPIPPNIKAVFDRFPDDVRPHLLNLRQQIFVTAAKMENCGEVYEALKWGQPSYQTRRPKTGTPIRLGVPKSPTGHYAIYVHCRTTLIDRVRLLYPDEFYFEGSRALILQEDRIYSKPALGHIITMALTYTRS